MVRVHPVGRGHPLQQFLFHFQWRLARGQAGAVADAEDVRVHRHGGLAKGHVEHHVGGLAAHTGQCFQGFAGARHLAAVLLYQDAASLQQVAGLGAVQADGFDVLL